MARNSSMVPENQDKLGNFKSEVDGDLTSREAGSIGGEMVKRMIEYAEKNMH